MWGCVSGEINWLFVVNLIVTNLLSDTKLTKTISGSTDTWDGLATIIRWAEREGRFLADAVLPICDEIRSAIRGSTQALEPSMPHISSVLKHILAVPSYARQLTSELFRTFFNFFAGSQLDPV